MLISNSPITLQMDVKPTSEVKIEKTPTDIIIISLTDQSKYDEYFKVGNDWKNIWIVSNKEENLTDIKSTSNTRTSTDNHVDSTPLNRSKSSRFHKTGSRSREPYSYKKRTRRTNSFNGVSTSTRNSTKQNEHSRDKSNGSRGRNSPTNRKSRSGGNPSRRPHPEISSPNSKAYKSRNR